MSATAAAEKTIHVTVGWSDDYESGYVYESMPGDAEGESSTYEGDVPEWLWLNHQGARVAYDATLDALLDAAGFDKENARLKECCPEWKGDVTPARTHWAVNLSASGDEHTWPIRDAHVTNMTTEAEARAFVDALPEEFYLMPAFGGGPELVRRDRLRIERSSYGPWVTECYRCGWSKNEHAKAAS